MRRLTAQRAYRDPDQLPLGRSWVLLALGAAFCVYLAIRIAQMTYWGIVAFF